MSTELLPAHPLRRGLPPVPERMQSLTVDERGYPVPWFVHWDRGVPDFRIMDPAKWGRAIKFNLCWLCGQPLGRWKTFVLGPMCAVNRTTSEPPTHWECAQFAVHACPFMLRPAARRRAANLPADCEEPAGVVITRNPGATGLWTCDSYQLFRADGEGEGKPGWLIRIGEPKRVDWYAQGRPATRAEVRESIDSGFPLLETAARAQGAPALEALHRVMIRATQYLPA
jgi:hypothetical protein